MSLPDKTRKPRFVVRTNVESTALTSPLPPVTLEQGNTLQRGVASPATSCNRVWLRGGHSGRRPSDEETAQTLVL